MGASFAAGQISPVDKVQNEWVPRSQDVNGGGKQGMRLVGLTYGADTLFDALAITDTSAHPSIIPSQRTPLNPTGTKASPNNFDEVYAVQKTALITSTLNEAVTLQPTWSPDGVNYYPFGSTVTVTAYSGTGAASSQIVALSTPSQYLPYVGLVATCATAPTSGELNATLARLG